MSEENEIVEEIQEDNDFDLEDLKDWGKGFSNNFTWGIALIAIGVLFLLENMISGFHFYNWWAIFILVPGLNSILKAWNGYNQEREITNRVRRAGFYGLFMILLSMTFFFSLDWGIMWPVFLIGWGLNMLLRK